MVNHPQKQAQLNKETAFVLGNGRSRLRLNLENLKGQGTIIGCNALYREFEPDHLVAVDVKMVNEIISAGYNKSNSVWSNPNKGISNRTNINFFHPHRGWSSGPTALHLACDLGHKSIYIFGFDYQGIDGKFNNVYSDTFNYKKSADSATFFGNWLNQTDKTIKEFKGIQFYRVGEKGTFIPDKLRNLHINLQHITFEEFERKFPNTIYDGEMIQKTTI
jgi:hypothetical protein